MFSLDFPISRPIIETQFCPSLDVLFKIVSITGRLSGA